jgi:hypothetical protein
MSSFAGARANWPLYQVKSSLAEGPAAAQNFNNSRYKDTRREVRRSNTHISVNHVDLEKRLKTIDAFTDALEVPDAKRLAFKEMIVNFFDNAGGAVTKPALRAVDLTTVRLEATFRELVRTSDLENPTLSEAERFRRAGHLLLTYKRLRRRDPGFRARNAQLTAARRIKSAVSRKRKRAKLLAALQAA